MTKRSKQRYCNIWCSIALPTLASSAVAEGQAQDMANAPAAYGQVEEVAGLEEVVVTAQKRKESAQSVPISIQAVSGEQIERMGVSNTNDLPLAVPGFQISSSGANQLYYLRGVGSQQVGVSTSAAVATFVDGVYMPFPSSALQGFNTIESIEVDKGPQGTLFGRNATGGVIQINTKDPSAVLGGKVSASYGNYDHGSGTFYLTGGVSDNVAADIALLADHQGEGYGKSLATGRDVFKRSIHSARTKWLVNLSDSTALRISADGSHVKGDQGSGIRPAKGVQIWDIATNTQQIIPGFYDTTQDTASDHDTVDYGGSVKLTSDWGWTQFMSITAYRAYHTEINVDFDGGPVTFLPVLNKQRENSFTQELQLSSTEAAALTWTVGAFYLHQHGKVEPFQFGAPFASVGLPFGIPLGDTYELRAKTRTTSYAGYAQATATILPDTHLTLGARYTRDEKRIAGYGQIAGPLPPAPFVLDFAVGRQEASYGKPTYRVTLDHDFTPSFKVYASFNRGFQSGGFNANNAGGYSEAANPALDPENIDACEVGFKSELFDRRLRVNASAFYYDYTNLQQQIYVDGTLRTLNAGAARNEGVDLEVGLQPTPNLSLGLVGEYLDAKFTDYANAPGYTYPFGFGVGPLVPIPIPNAKGNRLLFAPEWTGTFYVNHTLATQLGELITSATASYNDGFHVDPGNLYNEPRFVVVNLNEEWAATEQVSLSLWVKNLFDREYDQSVAAVGGLGFVGITPGAPREYGISARYSF